MLFLGILTLLLKFTSSCIAQSTNATCLPAYKWASNSKNQSPCTVAAYLESVCSPSPVIIPALPEPEANQYQGPLLVTADPCKCSTVTYSVISACGACQGHVWESWGSWSINCPAVNTTSFPKAIPPATEVPLWAYMNVTELGTFDPRLAQTNATTPSQSSTSAHPSTSNSDTTTVTPVAPSPTITDSTSNNHAGAIAGGVVGGLAAVVLIGLAAFWAYSHRHRSVGRPKHVYGGVDLAGAGAPLSPTINGSILRDISSSTPHPVHHHNMSESSLPPVSPMTSGIYTTFGARSSFDTLPQPPHGFRGVAEV